MTGPVSLVGLMTSRAASGRITCKLFSPFSNYELKKYRKNAESDVVDERVDDVPTPVGKELDADVDETDVG